MTTEQMLVGAIVALWAVVQALSGVVFKQQQARIAEKDARIATLETEAREAMKAKDAEKDEWRRMALGRVAEPPR